MTRYIYVSFIGLFLLFLNRAASAQPELKHFSNISVDKGLSQNTVYAITQDALGFIWMGTQDGLNRYDGNSFKVYRPLKGISQSIASFYIRCLFKDKMGKLWVGGNGGVSTYEAEKDNFINYNIRPSPGEWYISCIAEDAAGAIWASANNGRLFKWNRESKSFQELKFTTPGNRKSPVYTFSFLNANEVLLGTELGLSILNLKQTTTEPYHALVGEVRINHMFSDGAYLWIGTEGKGLLRLERSTMKVLQYVRTPGKTGDLIDDNVRSINKDSQGNLWVGTFRGLSVAGLNGSFTNYNYQSGIPGGLSQNSIRVIFRDRQDGMWLGTYYGGVNYYHRQLASFKLLNQGSGTPALKGNVVNVIKEDDKGGFWIGMEGEGLNYWSPNLKTISYYGDMESGGRLSSGNIKSIAFGAADRIFIGTHNAGLNKLNTLTGECRVFRHAVNDPKSISGDMVYALLTERTGKLWVGTRTGLDVFDPVSETFTPFRADPSGKKISSPEITYLMQDSKSRIWIGTVNGVNLLGVTGNLEKISNVTLSNDVVNFISEDSKGRIWIGTRDGLNLYDEKGGTFKYQDSEGDFLKGNINSIQSDEAGNLWITQNSGLLKFNPDTKQKVYFDGKGTLQNVQFNLYASCRAKNGMLLFGGVNGVSYFSPGDIEQKPSRLNIIFTGLELFNKTVTPADETGITELPLNQTGQLHFNHEQKQFTIHFNTFDYPASSRIRYLYKLDGFDQDWQQTSDLPRASYSNLQAGKYIFRVKAVGAQGELSQERTIGITVSPVWYKATWFYMLVFLIAVVVAYFLYRILTERMRAVHQLKLERIQREKVSYINKVKMDFFTNVSHELRTPLTLILAPLEEILNQPVADKKLRRSHEIMMRNTRRLYNIVNQLFEFKKTEMGTRQLRVGKRDLAYIVKDVYKSFVPLAEKKSINYDLEMSTNELVFLSDKEAVEHIIFNLLSNAFKYTSGGQTVTITLDRTYTHAVIKIKDTGKGIAREHLGKIFERFYQVDGQETNLGSGVGLAFTRRLVELHHGSIEVDSEPDKGSSFTVFLPLSDEAYKEDLLVDDIDASLAMPAPDYTATGSIYPVEELDEHMQTSGEQTDTLLIVDDNREIVSYLKEYFTGTYQVLTAYNGKEALSLIEDAQPVAIISDIMMPEMDGLHFCKKIKQNIQTSHIPVLLLTAKSETDQQLKGLEMGADDYITKPFSISVLEARLQNLLKARRRLREFYASGKEIEPEQLTFNDIDQEFLEKAIKIIETNLDEYDFSVEKLSRELGMSRSNLYLKVKAITGESVTALIKRMRLKKAAGLLEQKKYTVAEIAYMCGFNTPSYFSTAFKQFYGYMPTEYLDRKEVGKD